MKLDQRKLMEVYSPRRGFMGDAAEVGIAPGTRPNAVEVDNDIYRLAPGTTSRVFIYMSDTNGEVRIYND